MKIPNLESMIEEVEEPELEKVFTRVVIFEVLLEHFSTREGYSVRANDVYDYIKYICSFSTKVSHTKVFSDVISIYNQLGYSAQDIPAKDGRSPFTSLYREGILRSVEYTLRSARNA